MRLCAVGALLVLCAGVVCATDWTGFRGVDHQNVSPSPVAPLQWSRTDHVRWRTPLPGEGHSSPLVVGDAVYLSYAVEEPQPARLLSGVRLGLLVLAWALLATALWTVAARCREALSWRGLLALGGMVALAAAMALLVMYGENVLTFDRALERGWVAAVISLVLALVLVVSASGAGTMGGTRATPRQSVAAALGLIVVAGVAYLLIPDRAHAFDYGPTHPKSLFLFGVVVLPLFLGLLLGALSLRRSRPSLAWALAVPGGLLMIVGGAVIVLAVLRAQHNTRGVVSTGVTAFAHIPWWLPAGLLALTLLCFGLRRRWPHAWLLNVLAVLSLVGCMLVGLGFGLEHVIARTPYLVYVVGQPYYHPMVAPWVAPIFAGATLAALALALVAARFRPAAVAAFRGLPALLAVLLGAACFVYVLWVPRDHIFGRGVICLDRDSGAIRWQTIGLHAQRGIMHSDNSAATPTPVSDGQRVFAYFGTAGTMAVDRTGRLLWTNTQLPFMSTEGVSSSPIMWRDSVILLSESQAGQWLVALDAATGRLRWRTVRTQTMHPYAGNCRTPLLWPVRGQPTVIVWGLEDLSGYDPDTGHERWTHTIGGFGSSTNPVACPVADGERLYLSGPTHTLAVALSRLGQAGSPVVWKTEHLDGPQCATPVLHRGLLYMVSDTGTVYCLHAATGRLAWEHTFPRQHYASPLAVGDRVLVTDTAGTTRVLAAAPQYRLLATNDLAEPISASLVPAGGRLLVRTGKALWCLQ
jgi:outer membrane protein assembly factor BamB